MKAGEDDNELNNLQIAFDRIHRAIAFIKSKVGSCCNTDKKMSEDKMFGHDSVPNHAIKDLTKTGNGEVTGVDKSGDKYIVNSKSDDSMMSFLINNSLTVTVPIAAEESDFEMLNTEDFSSFSSNAPVCNLVRMFDFILRMIFD